LEKRQRVSCREVTTKCRDRIGDKAPWRENESKKCVGSFENIIAGTFSQNLSKNISSFDPASIAA